jgi:hypothetical protein
VVVEVGLRCGHIRASRSLERQLQERDERIETSMGDFTNLIRALNHSRESSREIASDGFSTPSLSLVTLQLDSQSSSFDPRNRERNKAGYDEDANDEGSASKRIEFEDEVVRLGT